MTNTTNGPFHWRSRALRLLLLLSLGIAQANDAESAPPATKSPTHARIPDDTPLDAVKWTGGFWQDRMRRLREIHLPGVLDGSFMTVENGATFRNLLRAAGMEEGGALGRSWTDGDCYLVLDVAARLFAYRLDHYLKTKLDYWIPIIGQIQLEDGMVDSWTVLREFDTPWERFLEKRGEGRFRGSLHYNTGSLYAFAATYQRATGDVSVLRLADRAVLRFMDRGPVAGPMQWAVPPLYARSGDAPLMDALQRVSRQASVFGPPPRDAAEIFGHNTTTAHVLLRETALCGLTGEAALLDALRRLAADQLSKKTYVTGAVAPVFHGQRPEQTVNGRTYPSKMINEGVGQAYKLPHDSAYCESCGQALYMEWYYRMFRLTGNAVYMDAAERAFYNTVPGCVDLDRPNFFYCNPQEQLPGSKRSRTNSTEDPWEAHYTWKRQYTMKCACCPPKVMRAIAMSVEMAYNANADGLWVNLYGDNTARITLPAGGMVECRQTSSYPWDGKVRLVFQKVEGTGLFSIFLRIPGWADRAVRLAVNGDLIASTPANGTYHEIKRQWKSGDVVTLELLMPVRYVAAHPQVADARGKVAVMRGPVVYCLEGDDVPDGVALEHVRVSAAADFKPVFSEDLGGVMRVTGSMVYSTTAPVSADRLIDAPAETALYRRASFANSGETLAEGDRTVTVSMIPYYARLNRKSYYFKIWLPVY